MSQTPNAQIPLVYTDQDRAGRITREWLPYLTKAANAAAGTDVTALQLASDSMAAEIAAAEGSIAILTATVAGLIDRVDELEEPKGSMVFQPAAKADQITMTFQPAAKADPAVMVWQR